MDRIICILLAFIVGVNGYGYPSIPPTVGSIWPKPQQEVSYDGYMIIDRSTFTFTSVGKDCDILQNAYTRYSDIIKGSGEKNSVPKHLDRRFNAISPNIYLGTISTLEVNLVNECEDLPHMDMDEMYELQVCTDLNPDGATLTANNIWGVLRGLESFTQLALESNVAGELNINCTAIIDFPRFSHRGVMLDTSRHYLPLEIILENLDLMGMNKFNVFHWHIVDDQSFPYVSEQFPDLSQYGSWSDIHIYTPEDVQNVIDYAKGWGIRVVVEFDTPGHTRSWGNGQADLLTPCYTDNQPDGTYGPINPSNENNYVFLQQLFTEIAQKFPDHYLHLGGDEVYFGCWQSNPDINEFMSSLNITGDYAALEDYYIQRLLNIVQDLPTQNGYIVWQEVFDNDVQIADDTVVHVWKYENNPELFYPELYAVTDAGYRAILSSCWYLNYIAYGVDWHKYYECDPHGFGGNTEQESLVMGGEACMWGEYVDKTNVISRTWPRAAPVAERLWSPRNETQSTDEAAPRLEEHRCRLLKRGYYIEPFGPSYCDGIL